PEGLEPVKMVVGIKDLDLATAAGVSKLEKRITNVIARFCGPPPRAAKWQINDSKACSEYAWASARPQMESAVSRGGNN
ncbi:UrcA family protein, partial [Novosphingobium sp.]|uniref:UrcA family protein n=1 Tax=Novosphingobium sp. TaxID=1874826 RepID=UPI0025E080F5